MSSGRILVTQGGGPTAVINESMVGVVFEAIATSTSAASMARGTVSAVSSTRTSSTWRRKPTGTLSSSLPRAPALGSTRDKPDLAYYRKMLRPMQALAIKRKGSHAVDY